MLFLDFPLPLQLGLRPGANREALEKGYAATAHSAEGTSATKAGRRKAHGTGKVLSLVVGNGFDLMNCAEFFRKDTSLYDGRKEDHPHY